MEQLSYVYNRNVANMRYTTIPSLLDWRAREAPHKTASIIRNMICKDPPRLGRTVLTFSDLAEYSLKLAASLLAHGIKPKDRIAVIGSCCPEYLYLEYACQRISVLMIRIPVTLASADVVVGVLKEYRVRAFVVESGAIEAKINNIIPGLLSNGAQFVYDTYGISHLEHIFFLKETGAKPQRKWKSILEICEESGDHALVSNIQNGQGPDEASLVFPTSGSTGQPKYVVHSHFSFMLITTEWFHNCLNPEDTDSVYMSDRPPSWVFGHTMLSAILGCTTVFVDPNVMKDERGMKIYANVADEEGATDMYCMTYVLHDMMHVVQKGLIQLPAKLKNVTHGGESLPSEISEFATRSFQRFTSSYGSTEAGFISYMVLKHDDSTEMELAPSTECRITDDDGQLLPRGITGNIWIRNAMMMLCYLGDETANRSALLRTGWLSTGDVGAVSEDGKLKLIGRSKEVISKGGNKIYPIQVESVVKKHPGVLKVVAIAVPDRRLLNEVCVCVIPQTGEPLTQGDLRSFCEAQFLAKNSLALPKYYLVLDEYPKLSTGKVDKNVLRLLAISKFNLE